MPRMLLAVTLTLFASLSLLTNKQAAAEIPFYYDMGTIHVQFEHESCGTRTLAVAYQIEFSEESQTSTITAYKPKIQSVLFNALNEHLQETGNVRLRSLTRLMSKNVIETLGVDVAKGVLITESQMLDL